MNPDLIALGVMVLLVLSVLVAWWYASRPGAIPSIPSATSFVVIDSTRLVDGTLFTIGSGENMEMGRVVSGDRKTGVVVVEPLKSVFDSGVPVSMGAKGKSLNRAQRRAKRWQ